MLGYVTEVDLKRKIVRTTFCKQVNTFAFNDDTFPLVEAMKVSAEHMHTQILDLVRKSFR